MWPEGSEVLSCQTRGVPAVHPLRPPTPALLVPSVSVGYFVANILWLLQFDLFYPDLLVHLA